MKAILHDLVVETLDEYGMVGIYDPEALAQALSNQAPVNQQPIIKQIAINVAIKSPIK